MCISERQHYAQYPISYSSCDWFGNKVMKNERWAAVWLHLLLTASLHARKETDSGHRHVNLRGRFPLNRELGETQRRLDEVKDVVRFHSYRLSNNDFPVLQRHQIYILLLCAVTKICSIISQIITLLHVSTLSCHPQGACNQYLAKWHKYFKCSCW